MVSCWCIAHWSVVNGCSEPLATVIFMGVCVLALLLASTLGGVRLVPESSCTIDLVRLLPCLPFVDGAAAAPSDMCCTNLGSMVHDKLQCLCQALNQPGTFPIIVNLTCVLGMTRVRWAWRMPMEVEQ
jgi:hypothetical protein